MSYTNLLKSVFLVLVLAFAFTTANSVAQTGAPGVCGNMILEDNEECDDGNQAAEDGCSEFCQVEEEFFCDTRPNEEDPPMASICGKGCNIIIVKDAIPPYDTEFGFLRVTFSLFGPPQFSEFTLQDPSNHSESIFVPFLSATFIAELPPDGWELTDISCDNDNVLDLVMLDTGEIEPEFENGFLSDFANDEFEDADLVNNLVIGVCIFGGQAICRFTNEGDPEEVFDLVVAEEAVFEQDVELNSRSLDDTEFPFSVTAGALDNNFSLFSGDAESMPDMAISTVYRILQDTPEGFILEDVICLGDADFEVTRIAGGVDVGVDSTGAVECTFINSRPLRRNVPTFSEWGLIATAALMGMAGLFVYRRRYRQSV